MKKIILFLIVLISFVYSCDLTETPQSQATKGAVFSSENGMKLYTNSFYDAFPSRQRLLTLSYYIARNIPVRYMRPNYIPELQGGWNWGALRNINYFIVSAKKSDVPEKIKNSYLGVAKFFRAYFYFNKLKEFGDLPWIDHPLSVNDSLLFAERDPRTLIEKKIEKDLSFAVQNISTKKDEAASTITSTVAAALKSRFDLWVGTFRKYHTEYNLQSTADKWLKRTAKASQYVMDAGYSIYTGDGKDSYLQLFLSKKPLSSEVLYAVTFDRSKGVVNQGNRFYTSPTFGTAPDLTRSFVNTYLMRDGSTFTSIPGHHTMPFTKETKNRDYRLSETIITPGYTRISNGKKVETPPNYDYAATGYQPRKFTLPDEELDHLDVNDNNIILFRYAEVLLNYAEAKAELGTLTNADWSKTIGVLRARAGITGGTAMTGGLNYEPTKVDPYLQKTYFPNINNPVILEIRRCREIELAFEGFSWADIQRWKVGPLLTNVWNGIYIPKFDVPLDMNDDGKPDVIFTKDLNFTTNLSNVQVIYVGDKLQNGKQNTKIIGKDGHTLLYGKKYHKVWNNKKYFHPIPTTALQKNKNLGQNPGW